MTLPVKNSRQSAAGCHHCDGERPISHQHPAFCLPRAAKAVAREQEHLFGVTMGSLTVGVV
ncbi:hypothetical protein FA10DRAFT_263768 [Acaromyces ingoldii]|uniref:Uncharacterized protein n=1 Tax=Acaromyces ingoldii TaxID=215250 RepID=A0A316YUY8_9BASI|nr:hypothetical protein FA10DRAFT_263768 [Acaromyces ingoldii]PWN93061.1 hypothetical protein FA10DRAFT_263768 [Acaromyces ingoldii]